jgi:histidinol-phosphatase (PHP family)
MILSDFHIHSTCSSDARDTMTDMAAAARENGVSVVCFTDHCDIDQFTTGIFDPGCFGHWPRILEQFTILKQSCPPDLDARLGLELGEINHEPELAQKIASQPELDFILGSIHNLKNTPDFYALNYESGEHCVRLTHTYLDELFEMAGLDSFDCVSHIGYARRYMLRAGFDVRVEDSRFSDQIDRLLRRVIERGKGIEINCSGYRTPKMNCTIPDKPILRRYRELGGEIITTGSDAHSTADAGQGLARGVQLLRETGYRYYTIYKNRKPEFVKID